MSTSEMNAALRARRGARPWVWHSLFLTFVCCVGGLGLSLPPSAAAPKLHTAVRSIALTVADLAAAEQFFTETLGFRREGPRITLAGPELAGLIGVPDAHGQSAGLLLGSEHIELVAYDRPTGRPAPTDTRSNDLWFQHLALVTSRIDALQPKLSERAISRGTQTIPVSNPNAGGIRAFYFHGPAQHPLELIWYPRDKGQTRWHETATALLGIDHTAIAVSDSARSIAFYVDLLGLTVAGRSFNVGREQEALSRVPGARVRITGLHGATGPGVELLEYEAPRDGRLAPRDTRATDLWSAEVTLAVDDFDGTLAKLRSAGTRFVSDRVCDTHALVPGTRQGVVVRDPDGHAIRIVQTEEPAQ